MSLLVFILTIIYVDTYESWYWMLQSTDYTLRLHSKTEWTLQNTSFQSHLHNIIWAQNKILMLTENYGILRVKEVCGDAESDSYMIWVSCGEKFWKNSHVPYWRRSLKWTNKREPQGYDNFVTSMVFLFFRKIFHTRDFMSENWIWSGKKMQVIKHLTI